MSSSIKVIDEEATSVIALEGNLDESLSPQLERALSKLDVSDDQKIIIDFEKVAEVTPDGVRVLINAFVNQNSAGLGLKNPNNEVKQLLSTVGLASLIQ